MEEAYVSEYYAMTRCRLTVLDRLWADAALIFSNNGLDSRDVALSSFPAIQEFLWKAA